MTLLYPQLLLLLVLPLYLWKKAATKNLNLIFLLLSTVFIIFALARPVIPNEAQKLSRLSTDIILAIDLSYSMNATDVNPNRFEEAKRRIKELLKKLPDDRFAVIGFTSKALILSPLSADHELLVHLFDALDREQIITRSTNLMDVLELTTKLSSQLPRQLLLFTDGGDQRDWSEEIAFAKENNIHIYVSLLGTKRGSKLFEDGSVLKDERGNIVVTRANGTIETLCTMTEGLYSGTIEGLSDALSKKATKIKSDFYGISGNKELFYIPLTVATLLFILGSTNILTRFFILLLFTLPTYEAKADIFDFFYIYQANNSFEKENFLESAKNYKKLGDKNWQSMLNLSYANYKAGEYEKALKILERIKTTDPSLKSDIYCRMGDTMLRLKKPRKAKALYFKSLLLKEDAKCRENYWHAHFSVKTYEMSTGEQKNIANSLADSSSTSTKGSEKEKKSKNKSEGKEGKSGAGGGKSSKTSKQKKGSSIALSSKPTPVSSKQYDLINKKSVNEKTPW